MSSLHLLLPPLPRFHNTGPLKRWLARGDRVPDAASGRERVLRELFDVPSASLPVAALLREDSAHDAGDALWLCADPASVRAEPNGARLLACGRDLALTPDDAESLAQPLRALFGDAGGRLEITSPCQWALRLLRGSPLPEFASPDVALGADLLDHLPKGESGRRWRILFNEAQVLLHSHAVNAARRERDLLPVNALWFWGAGTLPAFVKSSLTTVFSDDALVGALARRAGVAAVTALSPGALGTLRRGGNVLLDLAMLDARQIESEWLPRVDGCLRTGAAGMAEVAFASGERFVIRRWHRWRCWRRAT